MYTSPVLDVYCSQKGPGGNMVGAGFTTAGATGVYDPIYQPVKLIAAAICIAASTPISSPPIIDVNIRPRAGNAANQVRYCRFANPLADWADGNVLYYDLTQIIVLPGQEINWDTFQTGSNGFGARIVYLEPLWENPLNNPQMLRSVVT